MRKSIKFNIIFNYIKTLVNVGFPLITFPYATRVLGAEYLGRVQYCTSVISYFSLIATLGISIYAVREGSKYRDDTEALNKFVKEILIINTISTFIAYLSLIIYLVFYCEVEYRTFMVVTSLSICFTTYSIDWIYQIEEDFRYISVRAFLTQLVSLILMLLLVRTPDDYIKYAFIQILGSSGSFIFNLFYSKKYISLRIKCKINLKQHIVPIFVIFGVSLASSIYMNLDNVFLGIMKSTYEVGLYTVAVKMAQVVKVTITSFSNVLIPRMSYYVGMDKIEEYQILLKKSLEYIIMLTMPLCLGMFFLSKELIVFVCGSEYEVAFVAAKVLACNVLFSVIDGILYFQVLLPFKREKKASFCSCAGAILNLILNLIIIPKYSYLGAAATTLISEFIVFCGLLYFVSDIIKRTDIIKIIFKYLLYNISVMICCYLSCTMIEDYLVTILVSVTSSVISYFGTLYFTGNALCIEAIRSVNRFIRR